MARFKVGDWAIRHGDYRFRGSPREVIQTGPPYPWEDDGREWVLVDFGDDFPPFYGHTKLWVETKHLEPAPPPVWERWGVTPERLKEHEKEIASINMHGVDCPRSKMAEELAAALREAWGVMDEVASDLEMDKAHPQYPKWNNHDLPPVDYERVMDCATRLRRGRGQ